MQEAPTPPKITSYIKAAMATAEVKTLDNGSCYAYIPACPGVWSTEKIKICA